MAITNRHRSVMGTDYSLLLLYFAGSELARAAARQGLCCSREGNDGADAVTSSWVPQLKCSPLPPPHTSFNSGMRRGAARGYCGSAESGGADAVAPSYVGTIYSLLLKFAGSRAGLRAAWRREAAAAAEGGGSERRRSIMGTSCPLLLLLR